MPGHAPLKLIILQEVATSIVYRKKLCYLLGWKTRGNALSEMHVSLVTV